MGEHRDQGPQLSDVLYVERLIGPGVINTMPEKILRAFADHGEARPALGSDIEAETEAARAVLTRVAAEGIDLEGITFELEREGVGAFCHSYAQIRSRIESKLGSLVRAA